MNPSSNESGFNVPAAPELPAPVGLPEAASVNPERSASPAEKQTVQSPPPAATMPTMPLPLPAAPAPAAPASAVSSTTTSGVNATADDTDQIEKEWVEKAKKIVESTRDDPHKQSDELTVFKADYLQKRYGKTIKLDT